MLLESSSVLNAIHPIHEQINIPRLRRGIFIHTALLNAIFTH